MLGRIGVGTREQDHPLRVMRTGGPDLLPVDDVLVAITHGAGLQAGEVGAGARLGKALTPRLLTRDDAGQEAPLLLLGAVGDDRRAGPADTDAAGGRSAVQRQLLVED